MVTPLLLELRLQVLGLLGDLLQLAVARSELLLKLLQRADGRGSLPQQPLHADETDLDLNCAWAWAEAGHTHQCGSNKAT